MLTLSVQGVPYDQITKGSEEPEGIFRFTNRHEFSKKMKKSSFKVVYLEKSKAKEVIEVVISYDNRVKQAMIEVQGDKLQRSQVVKNKMIEDAFPINMQENKHGWKLEAQHPTNVQE